MSQSKLPATVPLVLVSLFAFTFAPPRAVASERLPSGLTAGREAAYRVATRGVTHDFALRVRSVGADGSAVLEVVLLRLELGDDARTHDIAHQKAVEGAIFRVEVADALVRVEVEPHEENTTGGEAPSSDEVERRARALEEERNLVGTCVPLWMGLGLADQVLAEDAVLRGKPSKRRTIGRTASDGRRVELIVGSAIERFGNPYRWIYRGVRAIDGVTTLVFREAGRVSDPAELNVVNGRRFGPDENVSPRRRRDRRSPLELRYSQSDGWLLEAGPARDDDDDETETRPRAEDRRLEIRRIEIPTRTTG